MKIGFVLLVLICLVACQSQPEKTASSADSTTGNPVETNNAITKANYFVLLKGTVDKYPVTMYLYALNHTYSGYYYYDSKQKPIYFNGEDSSSRNSIVLTASLNSDTSEIFTFSFDGSKASGTWKLGDKTLSLSLAKAEMPVSFDYVGLEDSAKLFDKLPDSLQSTAELSSVWPTGNSALDKMIKTEIARMFDNKSSSDDINAILSKNAKSFLAENEDDTSVTTEDIQRSPQMYSYEMSADLRVAYLSLKLISLSIRNYAYTGGAHGNYGSSYSSLNLQDNKVLKLPDIITAAGVKQLRPLLERNYRRDNDLQPSQSLTDDGGLFENKIEPNQNFYVTGKGLIFCYNPYEIASYAAGEIEIMIPYNDLQGYLQPAFQSLLQ